MSSTLHARGGQPQGGCPSQMDLGQRPGRKLFLASCTMPSTRLCSWNVGEIPRSQEPLEGSRPAPRVRPDLKEGAANPEECAGRRGPELGAAGPHCTLTRPPERPSLCMAVRAPKPRSVHFYQLHVCKNFLTNRVTASQGPGDT